MEDNYNIKNLKNPKPKRINSKAKGGAFERKVAKMLNEAFETKEFSRSPGSGAFATTHTLPEHMMAYGDIITPQNFKFCIECKKGYNKLGIHSLLDDNSDILDFIEQVAKDAEKAKRYPMVIYQQDRKPILAITLPGIFNIFHYIDFKNRRDYPYETYRIYKLDDLLNEPKKLWIRS